MVTWRNFENRYWPAKYLFNTRGEMVYSHFGEGAYAETEERIRNALVEAGADLSDDLLILPKDQARDPTFTEAGGRAAVTPELYAGWHRNFLTARAGRPPYVAQQEYFEAILNSTDQGDHATAVINVSAPDFSMPEDIHPHAMYFPGRMVGGTGTDPPRPCHGEPRGLPGPQVRGQERQRGADLRFRRAIPGVSHG